MECWHGFLTLKNMQYLFAYTLLKLKNQEKGLLPLHMEYLRRYKLKSWEPITIQTVMILEMHQHFHFKYFSVLSCQPTGSMRTMTASPG